MEKQGIPPFAALKAFEATFRLGGVRRAAESLGVSHAIVSRHIASLEDWLGLSLVSRLGNRLELNEQGRRYHAKVAAAFAELAFATRELRQDDGSPSLRLYCIPGLSIQWLSRQLIDFERSHPDFVVDLKPTDTPADLHAHEADANIVFHRDSEGQFVADRWIKVQEMIRPEQIVVTSPDLAAQLGPLSSATELLDLPLLHGGHQGDWRAWLAFNGVRMPNQLPGTLCWHVHMAIEAAKMGRGVLLTNRYLVQQELAKGELTELPIQGTAAVAIGTYMFIAREDRWNAPPIAALRRFLFDRMRQAGEVAAGSPAARHPDDFGKIASSHQTSLPWEQRSSAMDG